MKHFNEMTDEELAALTSKEVLDILDYECATEGVPLLPPDPGPEPTWDEPSADVEAWEVSVGYNIIGRYLSSDAAFAVADVLNAQQAVQTYMKDGGTLVAGPQETRSASVKQRDLVSPEAWKMAEQFYEEHTAALVRWRDKSRRFKDVQAKRSGIKDKLVDAIKAARLRIEQREEADALFARYVRLAEGDETTALRFMYAADPDAVELLGLTSRAEAAFADDEESKLTRALRRRVAQAKENAGGPS